MPSLLRRFWRDESGQSLTEYGLIITIAAVGLFAVLLLFRDQIGEFFSMVAQAVRGSPMDTYTPSSGG